MEPALSVANMASGSLLLEMDDAELKALWTSPGGGLRALSSRLTVATGCPRFRQRLFAEGDLVADESALLSPCSLQLVLLPVCATTSKQREQVGKAILLQQPTVVEELLRLCHDPNMLVPHGRSALHALTVAAINGNCECLRLLLEAEADVDVSKASGLTALQWAARKGHVEASQLLVSAMADVDKADGTPTALQLAAKCGHVEIVASLLQARANPDKKAWGGAQGASTALQQASENGHLQIVRLLVDAGADKEAAGPVDIGMTPLGWACYWGHLEICRLLVEARAALNS
ncbi:ANKRD50 [Symbiodinium sp. CCMP2456]|nr:ANKRD50 [Symbiodinium sp. CCMP2456]